MALPMHSIVKKLIGPILATGETNADWGRRTNLKVTIELVDALVCNIEEAANDRGVPEASMREIGTIAHEFLVELHKSTRPRWMIDNQARLKNF